jgi:hypothetical protein
VRAIDLACYADTLAAEASSLAARLERTRGRLGRATVERRARAALDQEAIATLERVGLLGAIDAARERSQLAELAACLDAVETLQAWVEEQLLLVSDGAAPGTSLD